MKETEFRIQSSPNLENLNTGFIKLYRSVKNGGWLKNHKLWAFWSYCLLKASHKEHQVIVGNQQVTLKAGQFIFGRKKATEEINLSTQEVRTCLNKLKRFGNIIVKSTNKYSIITIVNWDFYQGYEGQATSKITNKQPVDNQQVTTYKKGKNVRIKKYINTISLEKRQIFENLWELYPARNGKKLHKQKALEAFILIKDEDILSLSSSVREYRNHCESTNTYPRDAFRWLQDDLWKEFIPSKPRYYEAKKELINPEDLASPEKIIKDIKEEVWKKGKQE